MRLLATNYLFKTPLLGVEDVNLQLLLPSKIAVSSKYGHELKFKCKCWLKWLYKVLPCRLLME